MTSKWDLLIGQETAGRDEGNRTHGSVCSGQRTCIKNIEPAFQQKESIEGDQERKANGQTECFDNLLRESAMRQLHAAFKANGEQQVKRDKLRDLWRDFEIGFDQGSNNTQDKKEKGGVAKVTEDDFWIHFRG